MQILVQEFWSVAAVCILNMLLGEAVAAALRLPLGAARATPVLAAVTC